MNTLSSKRRFSARGKTLLLLIAAVSMAAVTPVAYLECQEQKLTKFQRELAHTMTKLVLDDVKKNYYDPKYHGIDIEARFRQADDKIEQASSFNQVFVAIQWALDALNDSHTHFVGPPRPTRSEYGWQMQMVGAQCLVTAVKAHSDAEKQGLHAGDAIVSLDNYAVGRDNIFALRGFEDLIPQTSLNVTLRNPDGNKKVLTIQAEIQHRMRNMTTLGENVTDLSRIAYAWDLEHKSKAVVVGSDLMIWKMPSFSRRRRSIGRWAEQKSIETLVLDLRGNPGGTFESLLRVVGGFFDHDVKVGQATSRKGSTSLVAKTRGDRAYKGKLVVLVDSDTASAAEIMARLVQIEKRGIVIGDRTAGAVIGAKFFQHGSFPDNLQIVFYGVEISTADLVLSDGQRLEGVGVTPDEVLLPTPADLAGHRDPVLARAASSAAQLLRRKRPAA